ncbi:hypothetical protein [Pseudoxanthomonas suwonensis]|uniref:Uncharacterized protein n=1 Tax=Pseudoxanthomonas suwonensis TaxID=314722 RepID=A0A0E3Z0S2_9GAMM|nr:hypothetical protein [Pseudoxanthomonas suwonensis]AKC86168.1 hypothetical protein WQ53_04645 [Pseudoxanthomonas suwonensis]
MTASCEHPPVPGRCPAPIPGRRIRLDWRSPVRLRGAPNGRRLPLPVPAVAAAAFAEPAGGPGR